MTNKIRFAHMADLHLGGWREKTLTDLNFTTFRFAIDKVIHEKVDFVIFAGDIFNTALPSLELVQKVTIELLRLKSCGIALYVIGGSHDYSNSSKSFIELLETVGVFRDVNKYRIKDKGTVELEVSVDEKTNARLCGILGKKKGLDKTIYMNLEKKSLSKDELNIFVFHADIDDLRPDFMKGAPKAGVDTSFLPRGFDYYAGGHIHTHMLKDYSGGKISYPGPLFPNNFSELKRERPSFNLCEFDKLSRQIDIKRVFIDSYKKEYLRFDFDLQSPLQARSMVQEKLEVCDLSGKIVLLEAFGIIEGKISDIGFNSLVAMCYERGALCVLKNTYKLTSCELDNIEIVESESALEIEANIVEKLLSESEDVSWNELAKAFLSLDLVKNEDEKVSDYEGRINDVFEKVLNR